MSAPTLRAAANAMADALGRIDTGEIFGGFTCGEIESIADVLRAAGRDDVARFILDEHAAADDEGDEHYQGGAPWVPPAAWVEPVAQYQGDGASDGDGDEGEGDE